MNRAGQLGIVVVLAGLAALFYLRYTHGQLLPPAALPEISTPGEVEPSRPIESRRGEVRRQPTILRAAPEGHQGSHLSASPIPITELTTEPAAADESTLPAGTTPVNLLVPPADE